MSYLVKHWMGKTHCNLEIKKGNRFSNMPSNKRTCWAHVLLLTLGLVVGLGAILGLSQFAAFGFNQPGIYIYWLKCPDLPA